MTEFRIANELVVDGRKKFLIPLLYEDVGDEELDADIKLYIDTHTYTDCKDLVMRILILSVIIFSVLFMSNCKNSI